MICYHCQGRIVDLLHVRSFVYNEEKCQLSSRYHLEKIDYISTINILFLYILIVFKRQSSKKQMYRQKFFFVFILIIISIAAQSDKKKICIRNLVINGTNLMTGHRKKLLVLGFTNFNNQSSRTQANR